MSDLKEQFEEEVNRIQAETFMSSGYRKKKLIAYAVRTSLMIFVYVWFWKHEWVRWTLLFYIPLNLLGLASILGWNYFLNKKIARTRSKIEEAEQILTEPKED